MRRLNLIIATLSLFVSQALFAEAEKTQNYDSVNRLCKKQCLDMGETRFRKEETFNNKGELVKLNEK